MSEDSCSRETCSSEEMHFTSSHHSLLSSNVLSTLIELFIFYLTFPYKLTYLFLGDWDLFFISHPWHSEYHICLIFFYFSCLFPMIISGDKHKCQNEDCNSDRRSAPLYVFIQMQLCQRESLKDWLKANQERNHIFCLTVFEQVIENLCLHVNNRYITCKQIQSILKSLSSLGFSV